MATIDENARVWGNWDWQQAGEEWSLRWGGSESQWFWGIFPRVHAFLPAQTVLEIATGCGRWTQYLLPLCERFTGVDLVEDCVEACRQRFHGIDKARFYANDGLTLPMVEDGSVDFAFSFDSLVHVDASVIDSYLRELRRVLRPNGVGFIQHSNLGEYERVFGPLRGLTKEEREERMLGPNENDHFRDPGMTAARFRELCEKNGLACVTQELLGGLGQEYRIDSISTFTPKGSKWERETKVFEVPTGWQEPLVAAARAECYTLQHWKESAK